MSSGMVAPWAWSDFTSVVSSEEWFEAGMEYVPMLDLAFYKRVSWLGEGLGMAWQVRNTTREWGIRIQKCGL